MDIGEGVAPSPDDAGLGHDETTEPTSLRVSVRRDFPLRDGERFGDWAWTHAHGARRQPPMKWNLDGAPAPGTALTPMRDDRAIFGWSIGDDALEGPGRMFTTDHSNPIEAEVRLVVPGIGTVVSARTSGADGLAELDTTGVSAIATIEIHPDDRCEQASGPDLSFSGSAPDTAYELAKIRVLLRRGLVVAVDDPYDPPRGRTTCRVGNRALHEPETDHLPVSLKPLWWQHPNARARAGGAEVDMVVVHCTSGSRVGNALNQFWPRRTGAHYLVDIDGTVIKTVDESQAITHVSERLDVWERSTGNRNSNDRSVGIEIINPINYGPGDRFENYSASDEPQPYTSEQYRSLLTLLRRLVHAHPAIGHRIVGHSDVACGSPPSGTPFDRYGTRRNWDPGVRFDWRRFERAGLGMVPAAGFAVETLYEDVFSSFGAIELRDGDRDPSNRPAVFGGRARPGFTGHPIRAIQEDLREIGYSIRAANGRYDDWTAGAVDRFRRHFESERGHRLGRRTALLIRNVASQIRAAAPVVEATP